MPQGLKVALVHDWLVTMGGAERVLEAFGEMFPDAPIYAGVIDAERISPALREHPLHPSLVQHWPRAVKWYNRYLPILAYAVEQWDLSAYDLVISSSSSVAKGVITPADSVHVSYVHSPMRYAWDLYHDYRDQEATGLSRLLMGPVFHYLRLWDRITADRPDVLVANSRTVARRIQKHWKRAATVVHPPVEVDSFRWDEPLGDYYLVLSRLVRYKRIDVAIAAANRAGVRLLVAGDGPERERLEALAGPTVEFLGRVDGPTKRSLMEGARALLFPGEEDFGIVPVEAGAAGRPVIALGRGGVLDTVIPEETGVFFETPEVDAVLDALDRAGAIHWDQGHIHETMRRFAPERFQREMAAVLSGALEMSGKLV